MKTEASNVEQFRITRVTCRTARVSQAEDVKVIEVRLGPRLNPPLDAGRNGVAKASGDLSAGECAASAVRLDGSERRSQVCAQQKSSERQGGGDGRSSSPSFSSYASGGADGRAGSTGTSVHVGRRAHCVAVRSLNEVPVESTVSPNGPDQNPEKRTLNVFGNQSEPLAPSNAVAVRAGISYAADVLQAKKGALELR
jgi:hypothetical protein